MKAFISYSHKDEALLEKLHSHLSGLRRQELLHTWTDREIHAGGDIDNSIKDALDKADLYLLLISADFINSDYCYNNEFSAAIDRAGKGKAKIIPIILRDCDWMIPQLKRFKALPKDGKPILSPHWHDADAGFADVAKSLRKLLEMPARKASLPKSKAKTQFIPDESNITAEQREELKSIHNEIVKRLSASTSKLPDEDAKEKNKKWYGIVWGQFQEAFGISKFGLQSLPREAFPDAKTWLQQYRASKDKKLKRTSPQEYRNTLTKGIYSAVGELGWSKEELYAFASQKLDYPNSIESLNDLGNNQLETIRSKIRYEIIKKNTKNKQARARRTPSVIWPKLVSAKEILDLLLAHPSTNEKGLTEILQGIPGRPLDACFIPNITGRGAVATLKKSLYRPALAELLSLGWLLPPEETASVRVYELNPNIKEI